MILYSSGHGSSHVRNMQNCICMAGSLLEKYGNQTSRKGLRYNSFELQWRVLLYGAESWTLTKKMRDRLDGNYTKMLRVVLNVSRKEHETNKELYGNLRKVTETLRARRLKFIGNSWRRKTELISKVLLWDQRERRKDHQLHTYTS